MSNLNVKEHINALRMLLKNSNHLNDEEVQQIEKVISGLEELEAIENSETNKSKIDIGLSKAVKKIKIEELLIPLLKLLITHGDKISDFFKHLF